MAVQPQQLDPLPIPEAPKEDTGTPVVPPAAKPQEGMGWVKPSGAGAYVASQILTGWMAGRHIAQQRNLEKAKMDVVGAKTTYDVTAQSYQNLVDQGLDPNKPEDKQKLDAAKMAVTHAWDNYLNRAQKYSVPDEDGEKKSKGKKVKEGVHNAFMGQDPQFFVDSSLKVLRQSGPPVLSYGTSQQEKNQLKIQQQTIEQNEQIKQENADKLARSTDEKTLRKQYGDALASGDTKGANQARLQYEQLTGKPLVTQQELESADRKAEAADLEATNAINGYKILSQPGKTAGDLSVGQRAALHMPMDMRDDYLSQVGPGKRFKNNIEADKQYLRDQSSAQAIAGRSATDRQWTQMKLAEGVVLAHDLQNPQIAAKYGISPLPSTATVKDVPDWLIEKSVMGRLKPTKEERDDARFNVDKAISHSINNKLKDPDLKPEDQAFIKENFVHWDSETQTYTINAQAPAKGKTFFGRNETVGGVPPEEYERRRKQFFDDLTRIMMKTNIGASKERIMEGLQSADPSGYFVDTADGSTPTSKALASRPEQGSGRTMFRATYPDGTVMDMELSEHEAEVGRDGGVKLDPITR